MDTNRADGDTGNDFLVNLGDPDPNLRNNVHRQRVGRAISSDDVVVGESIQEQLKNLYVVGTRNTTQSFMDYCGIGTESINDVFNDMPTQDRGEQNHNYSCDFNNLPVDGLPFRKWYGLPFREWYIPVMPDQTSPIRDESASVDSSTVLMEGAIFESKQELITVVGIYHLHSQAAYRVSRSSTTWYQILCKLENCSFSLQANESNRIWRVTTIVEHNCRLDANRNAPTGISSKILGGYFEKNLRCEGTTLIQGKCCLNCKLSALLKLIRLGIEGKTHCLCFNTWDVKDSFCHIPSYLHVLKESNPGTVAEHEVDRQGRFRSVFYALGACRIGFGYGRPVIIVDGTHLKGNYKGIVCVVVTKDSNNQIFPLAVGIGHVESEDTWTWFFLQLREAYPPDLIIVSDGHASIAVAVENSFPRVVHGLCCYHLRQNFVAYGQQVISCFERAACAYMVGDFNKYMTAIQNSSKKAFQNLFQEGFNRWFHSMCHVRRFDVMNSKLWKALTVGSCGQDTN